MFYIIYETIHPSLDFNGRMGRLLFLENTVQKEYFPLSSILCTLGVDNNEMATLFKKFSKGSHTFSSADIEYEPDQYFEYEFDKKDVMLIE